MQPRRWIGVLGAMVSIGAAGCAEDGRVVDTFSDVMDAVGIDTLDVGVDSGDLVVLGESGLDTIEVTVDLLTSRDSEDRDDEARHGLGLELRDMSDGTALLTVRDPDVSRYWADTTVRMPSALALMVLAEDGDVRVEDCGALTVDDGGGDLTLAGIVGDVSIEDGGGVLQLRDVTGDVVIDDGAGDLSVESVDGDVEIDDGDGLIDVTHVTGKVTIRDGAGDIEITDAGAVEIESDGSGSVSID